MSRHLPAKRQPTPSTRDALRTHSGGAHDPDGAPEDDEPAASNRPLVTPTVPRRRPLGPQQLAEAADLDADGRVVPRRR